MAGRLACVKQNPCQTDPKYSDPVYCKRVQRMCEHCPVLGICPVCQTDVRMSGSDILISRPVRVVRDRTTVAQAQQRFDAVIARIRANAGRTPSRQGADIVRDDSPANQATTQGKRDAIMYTANVYILAPMLGWYVEHTNIDVDGTKTLVLTNDAMQAKHYRSYADAANARREVSTMMYMFQCDPVTGYVYDDDCNPVKEL